MEPKRKLALDVCVKLGLDNRSLETIFLKMWRNVQAGGGYRLTQSGHEWMQELGVKGHLIRMPLADTYTGYQSGHMLLKLDRYLPVPYYLQHQKLYVYDESYATQLLLYAGDLKAFFDANSI